MFKIKNKTLKYYTIYTCIAKCATLMIDLCFAKYCVFICMNGATPLAANVHMYTFHGNIYMINISKTNIYMYLLKMKKQDTGI